MIVAPQPSHTKRAIADVELQNSCVQCFYGSKREDIFAYFKNPKAVET